MLNHGRWETICRTFDEFADLEASERIHRLETLVSDDPDLREAVNALLAADARADEVLKDLDAVLHAPTSGSRSITPDLYRLTGAALSHFRVSEPLGHGGMGVVYRAEDLRLGRLVALKFLLPEHVRDVALRSRFLREARAVATLDHPNLCSIHEVGETDDGVPFFAMPLYVGETLRTRLATKGALRPNEARDIARQIAQGLVCAHDAGLVHRDLKPGNVMLLPDGSVKIVDFGLAKGGDESLSEHGTRVGTVAYMSPEQLRGVEVDARTDLWSLGVVLYEMLTNVRPVPGQSPFANQKHNDSGAASAIPKDVRRILERLLQENPWDRYDSARAVLKDLLRVADPDLPVGERPLFYPRKRALLGVATLVMVALAFGLWSRDAVAPSQAATDQRASIAVLPMRNASADSTQGYFAAGFADELTTKLSQLESVRVVSHESVRQLAAANRTLPEIGELLNVRYIVTGSASRVRGQALIQVTVFDARRNKALWTQRFERQDHEVVRLQHEIVLGITQAIRVTLLMRDRARLRDTTAVNPKAFELYLRGTKARYHAATDANDFAVASKHLSEAINHDSGYAPPYAGLAFIHAMRGNGTLAREYATQALQLDPMLADAHVALGMVNQMLDWDWAGAEQAFREAIRLNPGHPEAHHELSMLLQRQRRFNESLREAQTTLELAPVSARFEVGVAQILFFSGRYEEALEAAKRALAIDSSYAWAPGYFGAWTHMMSGRYADALQAWSTCTCDYRPYAGYIYGRVGRRDDALKLLETLKVESQRGRGQPGEDERAIAVATVLMGLANHDEAVAWLEQAAVPGTFIVYLAINPIFTPLRANPRFTALLGRIGLA